MITVQLVILFGGPSFMVAVIRRAVIWAVIGSVVVVSLAAVAAVIA